MSSTRIRIAASIAAAAGIAALAAAPASAAKPDTGCLQAGIATLVGAGLMDTAARGEVTVGAAVGLGVGVREGNPVPDLGTTLPLRVILADHRAGENSYFVYPWMVGGEYACAQ